MGDRGQSAAPRGRGPDSPLSCARNTGALKVSPPGTRMVDFLTHLVTQLERFPSHKSLSPSLAYPCKRRAFFISSGQASPCSPSEPSPGDASGEEPTCQGRRCKKCGFKAWVGKILWRGAWQPTPVFSPGESDGQRSLAGYSPWGRRVGHD